MNDKPERRSRRRRAWLVVGLVLSAVAGVLLFYRLEIHRFVYLTRAVMNPTATPMPFPKPATGPTVTESVNTHAYFYRLKARYSYGDEPVEFDVVVGCSVRVTRYRGGNTGFTASRYPRFFMHETSDGHAVMQILPIACNGETTESGIVPADFMPGVIWFDKAGDYRFGIAYVSEDAFESPNGKLKFHGASVGLATREEWDAFRERAAGNEGMRKRYYDRPDYWTPEAQRIASRGGEEIEAAYARSCKGVSRYKLSKYAREVVRKYWPSDRPRYWTTKTRDTGPWPELKELERGSSAFANGFRYVEHYIGSSYEFGGFPTRARGGMFHSRSRRKVPPEFFPARSDRGIPWVFTEQVAESKYLTRDVEVRSGPGKGFLYCYTNLNPGQGNLEVPLPNYRGRQSRYRVDGEPVVTPEPRQWSWPEPFYEKDEYIYFIAIVNLS